MAKKIKKVETPIDQRETFVSIQKNFADSDLSVEEKLRTLYSLQKADSAIDKILQLRGELPVEVENLENEVADMKAKAAQFTAEIEAYNASITNYKHEIVEYDTAIDKYKEQMNSITNSREYDSLSKEVENHEILKDISRKNITDAKEAIAAKKMDLQALKEEISVRGDDLKVKKEELANIVEATAKEEKALLAAREACASRIDARTMSAYERIRTSERNHLAVVSVYNNDSCGGCFNTIIPQRLIDIASNKKLVICEHCGRIIVSNTIESEEA